MITVEVEIFTDGACRGNPGPGGWAALLRKGTHERLINGAENSTTNNRMELRAAIEGLRALSRTTQVSITTDSQYVRQGVTEWMKRWKSNGWKTTSRGSVKNKDLWVELDELNEYHAVQWFGVKGHSGHEETERVDHAANEAIDDLLKD